MATRQLRIRKGAEKQTELWYELGGYWRSVKDWSERSGRPVKTINSRVESWLRHGMHLTDEVLYAAMYMPPEQWAPYRIEAEATYVPPEPARPELPFLLRLAHGCPSAVREARGE